MQTTIYYSDEDAYLVKQTDAKGKRERKSRSSVILSVLEQHFECEKLLGDILLQEQLVPPEALERALLIQTRGRGSEAEAG